jgi:hypothetical protein
MQRQGLEGGVIAIKNIDPTLLDWLNTMTPLGTMDEDGNPTSEISSDNTIAGTYKKSQALRGLFEQVYGKLGLSITIDEDSTDSMDLTTGRDKTKGYQNIEGTFEFEMLNDDGRWSGAAEGNWDYLELGYYRRSNHRPHEMWILMSPNAKTLSASTAKKLWKFIGLKLGRVEHETGQPNKFRVPFFARRIFPFLNWTEPSPVALLSAEAIADKSVSLSTPIHSPNLFHTRLKFSFDSVTTAKTLTIRGYNIYGEIVTETIDLSAESGTFEYITKGYFSIVNASGVTLSGGWVDGTFDIDEYDVGLIPS